MIFAQMAGLLAMPTLLVLPEGVLSAEGEDAQAVKSSWGTASSPSNELTKLHCIAAHLHALVCQSTSLQTGICNMHHLDAKHVPPTHISIEPPRKRGCNGLSPVGM